MSAFAAVMSGKGTGAISIIQMCGDSAESILRHVFKADGAKRGRFEVGKILLGTITDGNYTIDQVTVGCEGPDDFAINCHGNPLIVEMIMQLLQRHGTKLITPEELVANTLSEQGVAGTIALEGKFAQAKAKTIQGTKIINNQIKGGLTEKAQAWLANLNKLSLDEIKGEANEILQNSQVAKLIIYGCTAVLAGPPNTGKSTLLNFLAGRQKAIVTDISGTTRDWVSAQCQIGPLAVELIDTAGLDEELPGPKETIEKAAQKKTAERLLDADLALLVLDNSQPATSQVDKQLLEKIADKKVLTVLNKSDLAARFDTSTLPLDLGDAVQISAKLGTGIENLTKTLLQICGVLDFEPQTPVCFTLRQDKLLKQLGGTTSKQHAASIITELLYGQLRV